MTKSVAETTIAIANKIVEVRRALDDAFNHKRKCFLSCTVEKTMREIERAFGNKNYTETEHLIEIIKIQIACYVPCWTRNHC
jgi:hypothetical protein